MSLSKKYVLEFVKDNNTGKGLVNGGLLILNITITISKGQDSFSSACKLHISHKAAVSEYTLFIYDIESETITQKLQYFTFWTNHVPINLVGKNLKFSDGKFDITLIPS